jgi:hypothetical protein
LSNPALQHHAYQYELTRKTLDTMCSSIVLYLHCARRNLTGYLWNYWNSIQWQQCCTLTQSKVAVFVTWSSLEGPEFWVGSTQPVHLEAPTIQRATYSINPQHPEQWELIG